MTGYGVSLDKFKVLRSQMKKNKIFEKDIKESFIRSSGRGGQNVNKVSTCVCLLHKLTRISIRCKKERSQGWNRYEARKLLLAKVIHQREREASERIHLVEKKNRQKRKRTKKGKEAMLEAKHIRSQKKENRHRINVQKLEKYL